MKKNYIYNMIYQVLSLLVPIITTPYLARTLGVDNIGIFSYTYSMVVLFSTLAILGTNTYGQRLVAYSRDSRIELSKSFSQVLILRIFTSCIVLVGYLVYIGMVQNYKVIYLLLILNIVNVIADITWFYQGLEAFKKIVIRNIFVKLLNLVSIYFFVHKENDLYIYILIYCGYTILGNLVTWIGIRKYIDFFWKVNPFHNFKEVLTLFIPTVAMQVYTIFDKVMLGEIAGSTYESGCYEQAEKIGRIGTTVVAAIAIVIAPRVAHLYNGYKKEEVDKSCIINLIYSGIRIACMMAFPIMFGLISVTHIFVPVFFGAGYEKVIILLPIFSFLVLIVGLANVIGVAYLISIKKQNIYTISIFVSASINLVLNIFLIPTYLSVGAALASVFAEMVGLFIQFGYCLRYEQFSMVKIIKSIWKYIVSSMLMFCCIYFIKMQVSVTLDGLVVLIFTGMFVYGLNLVFLKDQLVIGFIKKIKKRKGEYE